jgi:glucosamine 6-phosphate synthetase-like amidotransferase/phosphosugar isomerase protein
VHNGIIENFAECKREPNCRRFAGLHQRHDTEVVVDT